MRLHKSLLLFGASALLLAACGDDGNTTDEGIESEDSDTEVVADAENTDETENEEEAGESDDQLYEFNEVIADTKDYTVTLLEIEYIYDDMWEEEKIEARFDIENHKDIDIEVQARTVSLNGRMIDESLLSMSQEVAAGKVATAVLDIQDYEGNELPALEGDFEMTLHIFDWEYTFEDDVPVSVSLD